jgi:DNA-binding protein Fis
MTTGISLAAMEKTLILMTLQATDDNRTRATDILGITRRTRQNKLKEHGVQ